VDWNHIGVVGHSAGAHAALTFRAPEQLRGGCRGQPRHHPGLLQLGGSPLEGTDKPRIAKNRENMTGPLLIGPRIPMLSFNWPIRCRSPGAITSPSRIWIIMISISQGGIGRELRFRLRFESPGQSRTDPLHAAEEKSQPQRSQGGVRVLVRLQFFASWTPRLKGDAAGKAFLMNQYRDTKLTDSAPHVVYVPEGLHQARSLSREPFQPPTPRQLRYVVREPRLRKDHFHLRRFGKKAPTQPIYHPVFGLALVGDLLEKAKPATPLPFCDYYANPALIASR
jgi:hypothetical protein